MDVRRQLDLLRLRRQALRIAVKLFEAATTQADIDEVTRLFDATTSSADEANVLKAMDGLRALAVAKNVSLDG